MQQHRESVTVVTPLNNEIILNVGTAKECTPPIKQQNTHKGSLHMHIDSTPTTLAIHHHNAHE
jgi:hypothetical protein